MQYTKNVHLFATIVLMSTTIHLHGAVSDVKAKTLDPALPALEDKTAAEQSREAVTELYKLAATKQLLSQAQHNLTPLEEPTLKDDEILSLGDLFGGKTPHEIANFFNEIAASQPADNLTCPGKSKVAQMIARATDIKISYAGGTQEHPEAPISVLADTSVFDVLGYVIKHQVDAQEEETYTEDQIHDAMKAIAAFEPYRYQQSKGANTARELI